eukprot:TRINITY_DN3157_c0_g1_i1.p1 TRINITY_DN3157_c0_g1~~TRINITY_DN3157_c0_g1_i1.p1  ORF type:complete len:414 (+),score=135.65 TRINITY_DN3157_c0_g1_i1:99-1340(+)
MRSHKRPKLEPKDVSGKDEESEPEEEDSNDEQEQSDTENSADSGVESTESSSGGLARQRRTAAMGKAKWWTQLRNALDSVSRPGDFATSGVLEAPLPGLEVDGIGTIALPLIAEQAERLKSRCVRAPFGRGQETLVDPAVRNTWQLAPDSFRLRNAAWAKTIDRLLRTLSAALGLPEAAVVKAHIYKLLLYEPGSFFVSHRDTEKEAGMFGTLCLMLPSAYEGGALEVRHAGSTKRIDLAADNEFASCYAAFYADCQHELRPVTKGYRLALIYNLVMIGGAPPGPADLSAALRLVLAAVTAWKNEGGPKKLVYVLEHQYTPAGLTGLLALKNRDRAIGSLLHALAAEHNAIDVYLARAVKTESGSAECSRYSYWGGADYEMDEVYDSRCVTFESSVLHVLEAHDSRLDCAGNL